MLKRPPSMMVYYAVSRHLATSAAPPVREAHGMRAFVEISFHVVMDIDPTSV